MYFQSGYLQSIQCGHWNFLHMQHTFGRHETAMLQFISTHFCCQHFCFDLPVLASSCQFRLLFNQTIVFLFFSFLMTFFLRFSFRIGRIPHWHLRNVVLILFQVCYIVWQSIQYSYGFSLCSLTSQLFSNFKIYLFICWSNKIRNYFHRQNKNNKSTNRLCPTQIHNELTKNSVFTLQSNENWCEKTKTT